MKYYDKLIFIQAAADLQHALHLYDSNKNEIVKLCVINVKSVYEYLISLPLTNVTIVFYPYVTFNIKNPLSYIKAKRELKNIWNKDFKNDKPTKVYFFSRFYDWFTMSIVVNFIKLNHIKVIYYDHYDDLSIKNDLLINYLTLNGLRLKLRAFIHSYISAANFNAHHQIRNLEFDYKKYNIKKVTPYDKIIISSDYLYKNNIGDKKEVLFFLSPGELEMLHDNSKLILKNIILSLKKQGFYLTLKGHPRLGNPEEFVPLFNNVIPNSVPSEFICYSQTIMAVGIISTALNFVTTKDNIKIISLIKIVSFKDENKKNFYLNYLNELSKSKIDFVDNISHFGINDYISK
tara:strand:- start:3292 stop:4332 length:1041 start_codon:yes stop_codon:yes gene_type:complete